MMHWNICPFSLLSPASLAYLTAKTHGLQEEAEEIASALNVPPDQVHNLGFFGGGGGVGGGHRGHRGGIQLYTVLPLPTNVHLQHSLLQNMSCHFRV